jgi:16S rRNA (adenine1518-N6/adenine1519-N6)-dimethyltransferase
MREPPRLRRSAGRPARGSNSASSAAAPRETSADGLPPLRDVIERHGLRARKSLGQNFLLDLNLTGRIARTAGVLAKDTVVEVGPGPGGLTRALLANGAGRVLAIERDERCLAALAEIGAHYPGRLEVIPGDALKTDFAAIAGSGPVRIVANLPYNIGTELLVRWLTTDSWPPFYSSMTLMFQREVAERIVARPASPSYGRLGVLAGWRAEARIVFDVPPQAFSPAPKVMSSVVHIVPRAAPLDSDVKKLGRVTEAAFGQRRKMLRQSLKGLGGEELLEKVGIDGTRRAETLSVEEFVRLANAA